MSQLEKGKTYSVNGLVGSYYDTLQGTVYLIIDGCYQGFPADAQFVTWEPDKPPEVLGTTAEPVADAVPKTEPSKPARRSRKAAV